MTALTSYRICFCGKENKRLRSVRSQLLGNFNEELSELGLLLRRCETHVCSSQLHVDGLRLNEHRIVIEL